MKSKNIDVSKIKYTFKLYISGNFFVKIKYIFNRFNKQKEFIEVKFIQNLINYFHIIEIWKKKLAVRTAELSFLQK